MAIVNVAAMKLVKQRGMNDCGVAVTAMICDTSYANALWSFKGIFNPEHGLNWKEMRLGIEGCGNLHFKNKRPRYWSYEASRAVTHPCLLKVVDVSKKTKHWHWCAFDHATGYIFDPCDWIIPYWRYPDNSSMLVRTYVEIW